MYYSLSGSHVIRMGQPLSTVGVEGLSPLQTVSSLIVTASQYVILK